MERKKILVIDDDQAIRKSFQLALEDLDYDLQVAASGREGLAVIGKSPHDLIFLDLKMPEMSGVEVLQELREKDRTTPVYIITAFYGEYFAELKALGDRGCEFELLRKPISSDEIVKVVKAALEGPIELS